MKRLLRSFIYLQKAMMQLPNTEESLTCYAWMRFYFDMVGDCERTKFGWRNPSGTMMLNCWYLLGIQARSRIQWYQVLVSREVFSNVVEVLSVSVTSYIVNILLLFLWILIVNYLPPLFNRYVKIREIKAVTGKCATCSILCQLRKKFKDRESI